MKFPIEVGLPRRVVYNIREYLSFINTYNGKKRAIYQSVYSCNVIDNKANYNNINIDKLFFDFDDIDAWEETNKLHKYCLKENIKHYIIMSGRGYHLYVFSRPDSIINTKSCIYNTQMFFINKLNLNCDKQIVGDNSRLRRIPNTFNAKANRYCIPLSQEQFEKGDKFIKELASKQNFVKNITIGEKLFDIKQFDYQTNKFNEAVVFNNDNLDESSGNINYLKDAPLCIKNLLNEKELGWSGRYLVILYFKELGYTRQEVFKILQTHLSERKFKHCIQEERQLQYLFERNDLVFPSCDKIICDGFCHNKCEKYNNVIYK